MDEVDVFGDCIVIMVDGVVKCCGLFLFLKKFYGIIIYLFFIYVI